MRIVKVLASISLWLPQLSTAAVISEKREVPSWLRNWLFEQPGATVTGLQHQAFSSNNRFVQDSGACETTPGVKQASGYLTVKDTNYWFWYFAARSDADKKPLAVWFNGGPGCSGMIGLFSENGPCTFNNGEPATSPSNNPHSWNNVANMLYIDQPSSTGFSNGGSSIGTTDAAAAVFWEFIQEFYAKFPEFKTRDFSIFTESYGGHFGPGFAQYILKQNAAIDAGKVKGDKIPLKSLGIGNGFINAYDSFKAQIDFAANNTYKTWISPKEQQKYTSTLDSRCKPLLKQCWSGNSNFQCALADSTCKSAIQSSLQEAMADTNVYDVRKPYINNFPPKTYTSLLAQPAFMTQIGATSKFTECSNKVSSAFALSGDAARDYLPALSDVVAKGVNTLIYAGDADWICNWLGNYASANGVNYTEQAEFQRKPLAPYTVKGVAKGQYKTVGKLSFLKASGSGHTVPADSPELALQFFSQIVSGKPLSAT